MLKSYDPSSPLERIFEDIERAIAAKLYYPALLVALTVPEICMGLSLPKDNFVKRAHYVEFINNYTTPASLGLDGESCFQLRGGLVHRGDLRGHAQFKNSHVVFTVPESRATIHALTLMWDDDTSASMFDLVMFSDAIIDAGRRWYVDNRNDNTVLENMKNLIRWRPHGVPPFVDGVPVVASGV